MSDTLVQLPPNSTGIAIRVIEGDGATNQIPINVTEEAVIPTDYQGLFAGDARQSPLAVSDTTLDLIYDELHAIRVLLAMALE